MFSRSVSIDRVHVGARAIPSKTQKSAIEALKLPNNKLGLAN